MRKNSRKIIVYPAIIGISLGVYSCSYNSERYISTSTETSTETRTQATTDTVTKTVTSTNTKTSTETRPVISSDFPKKDWVSFTEKAIEEVGQNLLNTTVEEEKELCLTKENRKAAYVMLFSALAKFESAYKPETFYKENFKDAKGNFVISRGLLQISQESANSYGCNITDAKQLHDPETNLRCGVRILNKWVGMDKKIEGGTTGKWFGASRYWSVFRKSDRIKYIFDRVKTVTCKGK